MTVWNLLYVLIASEIWLPEIHSTTGLWTGKVEKRAQGSKEAKCWWPGIHLWKFEKGRRVQWFEKKYFLLFSIFHRGNYNKNLIVKITTFLHFGNIKMLLVVTSRLKVWLGAGHDFVAVFCVEHTSYSLIRKNLTSKADLFYSWSSHKYSEFVLVYLSLISLTWVGLEK